MGEVAEPTDYARSETRLYARAIVDSVVNDERMPVGVSTETLGVPMVALANVEELVFKLSQEIALLSSERDALADKVDDGASCAYCPEPTVRTLCAKHARSYGTD